MTSTVSTNAVTWQGNGATTAFAYAFAMPAASNATLLYTDALGNQTTVAPGDYTITGVGQPTAGGGPQGGTVTYPLSGAPIAAGTLLTLMRTVPYLQPNGFSNQGGLWPSVVEGSDDNLAMQIQQLAFALGRALLFKPADTPPFATFPPAAQRALGLLGFDGSGNPIVAQPSSALVSTAMAPVVAAASTQAALSLFGGMPAIATAAALAALTTTTVPGGLCYLLGYYASGDGGEGIFCAGTAATANGGTIINDASARSWYRLTGGQSYSVHWFGAKGDGVTNDTAAFNAATAAVKARYGAGRVVLAVRAYLIDPITLPDFVSLGGSIPGPFDGGASSPATTVLAPTLLVNSTGSTFVTLGNSSALEDVLIFYPQQVTPTASAPNVYPATVTAPFGKAGCAFRRSTLVNSYYGINWAAGRSYLEDLKIGAYLVALNLDGAEDWVFMDNIMCQAFYDIYAGLSVPQTIDTWVLNNGTGISIGRADAFFAQNIAVYVKYAAISLVDTALSLTPTASYGRIQNVDLDTVAYGVLAKSTNDTGGGVKIAGMDVGANPLGIGTAGQSALYLPTGGASAPTVSWAGGSIRGTWVNPVVFNAGQAYVSGVLGYDPVGDIGPPAFPATTVPLTSPYACAMSVFISGGTITGVSINGTATHCTSGMFRLNPGENIAISYTGTPLWIWFGD